MASVKILFCDVDLHTKKLLNENEILKKYILSVYDESLDKISEEKLSKSFDAEAISAFVYSNLDGEILQRFKNLKMVSVRSTGYNNVDLSYCKKNKIRVVNVAGYGEKTVAEFALGTLLSLTRKINFSNKRLRNHIVNTREDVGIEICGKTIGVVGTGAIGRHFIKLCHSFECDILAYDPFENQSLKENGICRYVTLDELFKKSDVISLHCPATPENHHLINKNTINLMKDGVFIINTARGTLIDSIDLYDSVISGKVAGAALDVLEYENAIIKNDVSNIRTKGEIFATYSLIDEKLLQLPNVIITPHIAFNSVEAGHRIFDTTVKNIDDFFSGREIKYVV